jgi:hypothetical protein
VSRVDARSGATQLGAFNRLINMFFRSAMFFNVQLYGGLLLFSLFVIFDTQVACMRLVCQRR